MENSFGKLKGFDESICFISLEENQIAKIPEFFKQYKNVDVTAIYDLCIFSCENKYKELAKKNGIKYEYDFHAKAPYLQYTIDYSFEEIYLNDLGIEDVSRDGVIDFTWGLRSEIVSKIEENLYEFIGYDELEALARENLI